MQLQPVNVSVLCRDCGTISTEKGHYCLNCRGQRRIAHQELRELAIAHVDCDAFFASIEKRDRPELLNKPVIVGGGKRGVVSTCCYIARSYGVRSAMPMFKALKACPQAVVVKSNFAAYKEAAAQIREEMQALTPLVQPVSIDEAYLDLSGTDKLHGRAPAATLALLAQRIEERVGITVSIGLSHNKLLAKIASELDKPLGFAIIGKAETPSFLAEQPPSILPGIGPRFATRLISDGFNTLGDIQRADDKQLVRKYGENALSLRARSFGQDDRPVRVDRETKSISGETTFSDDLSDRQGLEDRLYAMAQKVSARAKEKSLAGRVVTLKLKTKDFRSFTRRETLPHPTNLAGVLFDEGRGLLAREMSAHPSRAYRLIGIGISDLTDAAQMEDGYLFADAHKRLGRQEAAIAALNAKFGDGAVGTFRDHRTTRRKD